MFRVALTLSILLVLGGATPSVFALERHIHARAGGSSAQQLPLIVAKDLGLFEKYGLNVELLEIRGGSLLMQALIGQSVNSADVGAQAPIRAILSGQVCQDVKALFGGHGGFAIGDYGRIQSSFDLHRGESRQTAARRQEFYRIRRHTPGFERHENIEFVSSAEIDDADFFAVQIRRLADFFAGYEFVEGFVEKTAGDNDVGVDVEILAKADPEYLAPKAPNLESEYNVVLGLLQSCRYGRHQLPDPEGNFIDVAE